MSADNEEIRGFLFDTLVGIDVVATQARELASGDKLGPELAIIQHAARAAIDLLDELQLACEDDEGDDNKDAGSGRPPKLAIVD